MSKRLWVGLWFALQICSLWSLDITHTQAQVGSVVGTVIDNNVTANLITSPLSPVVNYTGTGGGYSGGNVVGYNATNNSYYFGYTQQTIGKTIAINQALQGSGVQVNGVQYGMSYLNGANSYGTLGMNVNVTSNTGSTLQSYSHTFNTQNPNWQQFDQTQTFTNPYTLANLGNVSMSITGKDSRYWAGYYGPIVKDPYLKLTYGSDPKTYYNIADDGYVPVTLPFSFPFYGRTYTTGYFFSNGVVGFLNPNTNYNNFCCDGVNLSSNPGSPWNFAIYALQTDLIAANANAKFYTQTNSSSYLSFNWQNINEYGTSNLNTFSATIKPTGYIGLNYQQVNVQNHNVTSGIAGDLSQGQYSQYYNGPGSAFPIPTAGTTITFTGTEVVNQCLSNPLYSTSCPGYTNAMCQINPLYSTACAGYAQAYHDQQCSVNPLYASDCPGYAQAYHDQQCSLNTLYATDCPGYAAAYLDQQCSLNPLYSTTCSGYATAYHNQQCSINPLYATDCTGYAAAYLTQQCTANSLYSSSCPGYAVAYKAQQCSLNALYATDCPGYQQAYFNQQCTANPLYNTQCPGYQQAYFNQQCTANGLYSTQCPNYGTAYATQQALQQSTASSSTTTTTSTSTTTTTAPVVTAATTATTGTSTGTTSSVPVAVVADPVVNNIVTSTSTATNSATAPAAAVSLTPSTTSSSSTTAPTSPVAQTTTPSSSSTTTATAPAPQTTTADPSAPKPARQELQEKRVAAARAKAVEEGKNADSGKAESMEKQKEIQNVVIQAMGFTPGFDAYGKVFLPDGMSYRPFTVYNNQKNVDNRRVGLGLYGPSDRLHEDLVSSQYNRGE